MSSSATEAWKRIGAAFLSASLQQPSPVRVGERQVAACRRAGIAGWLPGCVYVGWLCILLASLVGWRLGWRGTDVTLLLGETQPLDGRTALAARLDEVILTSEAHDEGTRVDSRLSLLEKGVSVKSVALAPGVHARYGGVALYQVDNGPAARVVVRDAQGRELDISDMADAGTLRAEARLAFVGSQQERLVIVPAADLLVRLVHYTSLPSRGLAGRVLYVQLMRWSDGQALAEQFLDRDATLSVTNAQGDQVSVEVAFEAYVVVRAEREPELPLAAAGGLLALLGMAGMLFWPPRWAWVQVEERGKDCVCRVDVAARDARADWMRQLEGALELGSRVPARDSVSRAIDALVALLLVVQTALLLLQSANAQQVTGSYWSWTVSECWWLAAWLATAFVCVGRWELGWGYRGDTPEAQ